MLAKFVYNKGTDRVEDAGRTENTGRAEDIERVEGAERWKKAKYIKDIEGRK